MRRTDMRSPAALISVGIAIARSPAAGAVDHLLITEIRVGPTAGEFVEIYNPAAAAIALDDYYLFNATYPGSELLPACWYYDIVANPHTCAESTADFSLRFPDGASIEAGQYQIIALTGAANYCSVHFPATSCVEPDYEIPPLASDDVTVANMRGLWDTSADVFTTFGFLTRESEEMVLYAWSSPAAIVSDVDYVIWGPNTDVRTDKTAVAGYLPDTPIGSQSWLATLGANASTSMSYQRACISEVGETPTGGNGITGHNETGEILFSAFVITEPTPGGPTTSTDADGDGVCDSLDQCLGDDSAGDADSDLVCADIDCADDDPAAQFYDNCGICGGDDSSCGIFADGFESGGADMWSAVAP